MGVAGQVRESTGTELSSARAEKAGPQAVADAVGITSAPRRMRPW